MYHFTMYHLARSIQVVNCLCWYLIRLLKLQSPNLSQVVINSLFHQLYLFFLLRTLTLDSSTIKINIIILDSCLLYLNGKLQLLTVIQAVPTVGQDKLLQLCEHQPRTQIVRINRSKLLYNYLNCSSFLVPARVLGRVPPLITMTDLVHSRKLQFHSPQKLLVVVSLQYCHHNSYPHLP